MIKPCKVRICGLWFEFREEPHEIPALRFFVLENYKNSSLLEHIEIDSNRNPEYAFQELCKQMRSEIEHTYYHYVILDEPLHESALEFRQYLIDNVSL